MRHVRGNVSMTRRAIGTTVEATGYRGLNARILVRVKTESRSCVRAFRHFCQLHGLSVQQLERHNDGPQFAYGQFGQSTWFDVAGTPASLVELNELDLVLESEFAVNVRVPWAGGGAGPEKVRKAPETTFTPSAVRQSQYEIAKADEARHERNLKTWGAV